MNKKLYGARVGLRGGESKRDRRTRARQAFREERPAVLFHRGPHDREPEAGSTGMRAAGTIAAEEWLRDVGKVGRFDSHTGIGDAQGDVAARAVDAQSYKVDFISGATFTSDAFIKSLQAALKPAGI